MTVVRSLVTDVPAKRVRPFYRKLERENERERERERRFDERPAPLPGGFSLKSYTHTHTHAKNTLESRITRTRRTVSGTILWIYTAWTARRRASGFRSGGVDGTRVARAANFFQFFCQPTDRPTGRASVSVGATVTTPTTNSPPPPLHYTHRQRNKHTDQHLRYCDRGYTFRGVCVCVYVCMCVSVCVYEPKEMSSLARFSEISMSHAIRNRHLHNSRKKRMSHWIMCHH